MDTCSVSLSAPGTLHITAPLLVLGPQNVGSSTPVCARRQVIPRGDEWAWQAWEKPRLAEAQDDEGTNFGLGLKWGLWGLSDGLRSGCIKEVLVCWEPSTTWSLGVWLGVTQEHC